ncbi:MAG: hypothetical protein OHK0048_00400 [Rhodoferax sp.]
MLSYQVRSNRFPYRLRGELKWQNLGTRYVAELSLGALGLNRQQQSRGQILAHGLLQPERFSDSLHPEQAVHFDSALGRIHFGASHPDVNWVPGCQDRLSVLLQLGRLQARLDALSPGHTVELPTVGPGALESWSFVHQGLLRLDLPGGTIQAQAWKRAPRTPDDQQLWVWLAPEWDHFPVRLRILETNGDEVDQQITARRPLAAQGS